MKVEEGGGHHYVQFEENPLKVSFLDITVFVIFTKISNISPVFRQKTKQKCMNLYDNRTHFEIKKNINLNCMCDRGMFGYC